MQEAFTNTLLFVRSVESKYSKDIFIYKQDCLTYSMFHWVLFSGVTIGLKSIKCTFDLFLGTETSIIITIKNKINREVMVQINKQYCLLLIAPPPV